MTGGSLGLGIRSSSYGSLEKHFQQHNGVGVVGSIGGGGGGGGVILPIQSASRPKQGKMLKEKERMVPWIFKFVGRKKVGMLFLCIISAAVFVWVLYVGKGEDSQDSDHVQNISFNSTSPFSNTDNEISSFQNLSLKPPPQPLPPAPPPPPPSPPYFLGYTLPQGHPCNSFTLPPPPSDKKRTGPRPCPVCYLPVEEAIALMPKFPSFSPVIQNLTYIHEDPPIRNGEFGGSDFGGYPTLKQRNDSYDIKDSISMHCGFVRGEKPGRNTGFDMDETDLAAMEQCDGVVVASAIFGAFDDVQQPSNISEYSKQTVCFFMFVDEETEAYLKQHGGLDSSRKIGIWRIIVVHNLPYMDGRRNGKVPKLLSHRMFPNARYSLWIDGKLELVVDPYQILERHLWRKNASFAISRHYKRFDVFVEAEANKVAGKYDNESIDFQIDFYRKEGLTPYSEAKLPITSDVPEGCVIIREHVPITNLFTCLWFNEVDLFTSRDQISFSTVRDKVHAKTNWTVNMFLDCERRNFVVQKYHRDVLEHMAHPPPPPALVYEPPTKPALESAAEKGVNVPVRKTRRGRKSGSRRHRKVAAGDRDMDSS
ncbi:probable hexosyltransferase MUCI70 [Mercurialis annua]|uniref:probable hexosyltransferase MUCI70 n=1 Tax=Mercurialis annua TaxID=3986 RepID=UPI0021603D3A|nr:probable hexosyltransferase MUCI70 [Mercurialis annua]